jgi:hypothetical protein
MAEIVLVHGIDQQQKSADLLESEWLPALAGGVRTAGFSTVADRIWRSASGPRSIEARMAFYGSLFLTPGQQGDSGSELCAEEAGIAKQLAEEWLKRVAVRATKQSVRNIGVLELALLSGETMGAQQGLGRVLGSAINGLGKIPWFAPYGMGFAERFVNRALAQVTRYLTDDGMRSKALASVFNLIGPETKVLIGHSLGSVVAYEAAHLMKQRLPLLVTLGSPLGLQTIVYQRLRPQPPGFPANVAWWVNVADRDDFIAAEPDLDGLFGSDPPGGAQFDAGYTVDNGAEPHNCQFYLGKFQVGRPVGEIFEKHAVASSV